MSISFVSNALDKLTLPSPPGNAQTAEAWAELYKTTSPVRVPVANQLLSTDSSLPMPQSLSLTSFGAR